MNQKLTDEALIEELRSRFEGQKKALEEVNMLMSELKALNKRLEHSEKLKTQFLSNIRNEIINPFSSIMGFAKQLAEQPERSAASIAKMGGMIFNEAFSLDFQLQNIFAAAELEAGEAVPEVSQFSPIQLVGSQMERYAHKAAQKGITLVFDPQCAKSEHFSGDAPKIGLCVSNLLANAIAYGGNGKKVHITLSVVEQTLTVAVQDEGAGIAEEHQGRIFDRFIQLDAGMTKENPGHGLGLSVAKALANFMNGELQLESELHKGSCFTLLIPEAAGMDEGFATDDNEVFFSDDMIF